MDAVAAIASVVGILSFAGQALQGLMVLEGFLKDASQSQQKMAKLLRELGGLKAALEQITSLMGLIKDRNQQNRIDDRTMQEMISPLEKLHAAIEQCHKEVDDWVSKLSGGSPRSNKGFGSLLKRLQFAFAKEDFNTLWREVSSQRQVLTLLVSTTNG
jgi:hypothetical protein